MNPEAIVRRLKATTSSFTPAQMTIAGLLVAVALVGLFSFGKWASKPSYSVLFSGLEAKDAAAVTERLQADGVDYRLSNDGTAVMVPAGQVYDLRLALSSDGLPSSGVVGYELLDKQGITTSEFSQRVGYQRALEGELTRTILAMRGIETATVHLAIPGDALFQEEEEKPRASVLVDGSNLNEESVQSIVHLVASSVSGLEPEAVTVADVDGRVLSSSSMAAGTVSTSQLRMTQQYESNLASEASSMLAQVFGPGHAVVRVSASLDFDEKSTETETFGDSTAVRTQTETESLTGSNPNAGGTVGTTGTQLPDTTDGTYNRENESTEFGVDRTVERAKTAPGKLQKLSVAVVLDETAEPVPDAAKVESIITAALGLDSARGDAIVVDSIPFETTAAEAAEEAAAANTPGGPNPIEGYARTGIGALVLLAITFALFRSMRSTKVETLALPSGGQTVEGALAALEGPHHELPSGMTAGDLPALGSASAPDVLQLVDQQPDEVAGLLRDWLSEGTVTK